MVDYCAAAPSNQGAAELEGAPALLLVHGFGAFGEQWRGQLAALAAAGFRVRRHPDPPEAATPLSRLCLATPGACMAQRRTAFPLVFSCKCVC